MPTSVLGAVRIGLNRVSGRDSYFLLLGSNFANGQTVTVTQSTFRWAGDIRWTDGTFAFIRVTRTFTALETDLQRVPLLLPTGPATCTVTIDDGTPTNVVVDIYDA